MKSSKSVLLLFLLLSIGGYLFWGDIVSSDQSESSTPKDYFIHLVEEYRDSLGVPGKDALIDFFEQSPYPYQEEDLTYFVDSVDFRGRFGLLLEDLISNQKYDPSLGVNDVYVGEFPSYEINARTVKLPGKEKYVILINRGLVKALHEWSKIVVNLYWHQKLQHEVNFNSGAAEDSLRFMNYLAEQGYVLEGAYDELLELFNSSINQYEETGTIKLFTGYATDNKYDLASALSISAMQFIISHELSHILLKHVNRDDQNLYWELENREEEADLLGARVLLQSELFDEQIQVSSILYSLIIFDLIFQNSRAKNQKIENVYSMMYRRQNINGFITNETSVLNTNDGEYYYFAKVFKSILDGQVQSSSFSRVDSLKSSYYEHLISGHSNNLLSNKYDVTFLCDWLDKEIADFDVFGGISSLPLAQNWQLISNIIIDDADRIELIKHLLAVCPDSEGKHNYSIKDIGLKTIARLKNSQKKLENDDTYLAKSNMEIERMLKLIQFEKEEECNRYFTNAATYKARNEVQLVVQELSSAIECNPYYFDAIIERGHIYMEYLKDYNLAKQDFDKCLDIDPYSGYALYNRGTCYFALQKYEEALVDFIDADEIELNFPLLHFNKGLTYYYLGEYVEAKKNMLIFVSEAKNIAELLEYVEIAERMINEVEIN